MPRPQKIHTLCEEGNLKAVQKYLEEGGEPDALGPKLRTPLHMAVKGNHVEIARELIKAGADIEARTAYKFTPLHIAAFYGSCNALNLLVNEYETNIEAVCFGAWRPLHYACNYGHEECAKLLAEKGAKLSPKSAELGYAPLHFAARSGSLEAVEVLLSKGCNPNQRNVLQSTPLHLAAQNDQVKVVEALLRAGAQPDAPDEAGITPIRFTKNKEVMDLLRTAEKAPPSK